MSNRFMLLILFVISTILLNNNYAQETIKRSGGLARIMSLGDNLYVEDPQDLKTNPAYGSLYDNFIWGDIGSKRTQGGDDGYNQFLGVNLRINDDFTVGAILTRNDQYSETSITSSDPMGLLFDWAKPNNNTELFSSYKFEKMAIGLGISYLTNQSKKDYEADTLTDYLSEYSQFGINAGILFDLSNNNKLDIGLSMLFPKLKSIESEWNSEATQIVIKADVRAFITLNKKMKFVPVVNFLTSTGKLDINKKPIYANIKSDDLETHTQLLIGAGINYKVDKFLLAGGPSIIYNSIKYRKITPEIKESTTGIQWNFGVEWDCTSWLVARIGYKTVTSSEITHEMQGTQRYETTKTTYGANDGFTLGLGFNFEGFSLDATVNDDIIRQGLNNIGGGNATLGFVSVSYAF